MRRHPFTNDHDVVNYISSEYRLSRGCSNAYARGQRRAAGRGRPTEYRTNRALPFRCRIGPEPLLDTIKKLFFMAWELACYAGLLVNREAAPVFARSISESAGSARRAFELRTRTVIRSDGILHEPLLRERALC